MLHRILLSLIVSIACAIEANAETRYYQLTRKGSPAGHALITVEKTDGRHYIDYRTNLVVKILGIPVFRRDSHQRAVFDSSKILLAAVSEANVDGEEHTLEVQRDKSDYVIKHNGTERRVPVESIAGTTLDPVLGVPAAGKWLDLIDGEIEDYTVSPSGSSFELKHPTGSDVLSLDSSGVIEKAECVRSKATIVMTYKRGRPSVDLPPLLNRSPSVICC